VIYDIAIDSFAFLFLIIIIIIIIILLSREVPINTLAVVFQSLWASCRYWRYVCMNVLFTLTPSPLIFRSHTSTSRLPVLLRQVLELSDNALTGTLSSSFASWTDLTLIDISDNQLSGPLEDTLVSSWENLEEVNLSSNSFNGTMPQTWSTSLQFMKLNDNQFHSELPSSVCNKQSQASFVLNPFTLIRLFLLCLFCYCKIDCSLVFLKIFEFYTWTIINSHP
jgi:hypothetical protein